MINIRELRNKNWLSDKDNIPRQVDYIGDVVGLFNTIGGVDRYQKNPILSNNIDDLNPIPFTTEWAQRFGLIGRIINGLCISESEYQGHEYDLCLYDEHTWDSERRVICPIYYVHQCQNIFLDLAGHIIE